MWGWVCDSQDVTQSGGLIVARHGTLTPCFTDLCISLSHYFLAACTAFSMGAKSNSAFPRLHRNWRLKIRRVIASLLISLPVVYLLIVQLYLGYDLTGLRYISVSLVILVWTYHLTCYLQHKRKREFHITFASGLCMLSYALKSYSLLNEIQAVNYSKNSLSYNAELYTNLCSTILLLAYTCLTVRPWTSTPTPAVSTTDLMALSQSDGYVRFSELEDEVGVLGKAEEGSNILSLGTFWWVGRMMRRGFRGNLNEPQDLYDLPDKLLAEELAFRYSRRADPRHSLVRTLHMMLGTPYYLLGVVKLLCDICSFCGPILLNGLVTCFENPDTKTQFSSYTYAAILGATSFLNALLSTHYNYELQKVTLKLKTTLVTAIYSKTLHVGLEGRKYLSGQAINLMTSDTERVANFCGSFHMFWSLPLQVVVTLFIMYMQVGTAFLAGLAFVIILIPINKCLANRIGTLSEKMMAAKDRRISLIREVLRGMLYVKMHVWTNMFKGKIETVRKEEMKQLAGRKYLDALCVFFWAATPVLVSVLTFVTYALLVGDPSKLTASKVFTTLSLFNMLIMPLNAFPWVINGLVEARVSLGRMENLMKMDDFLPGSYYTETVGDPSIIIRMSDAVMVHANYVDDILKQGFRLGPLSFTLKKGEFLGVYGEVGSGKSSLFSAILGEMKRLSGNIEFSLWNKGVAYVSQNIWLQKTSLRQSVTFGQRFDAAVYNKVITACALTEDIKSLRDGDLTDIGEDGGGLSGGQKMRVSLARAVYATLISQDTVLVLLDDPFSSLDVHVANKIYRSCICDLLQGSTIILATHHTRFLEKCTFVMNIKNGQIVARGTPGELLPKSLAVKELPKAVDEVTPGELMGEGEKEEQRVRGSISGDTLLYYGNAIGFVLCSLVVAALLFMQISRTSTDAWLAYYVSTTQSPDSVPSKALTEMLSASDFVSNFFTGYISLAVVNSALTLIRAFIFAYAGLKGAIVLHDKLLLRCLEAPLPFFDRTPLGQILNRLSSDVYTVDDSLPFIANVFFAQSFSLLGTIILTVYGLPWIMLLLLPLSMGYASVQRYYRWTSRELKRLTSVTLSPLYSHISESFSGVSIIRSFAAVPRFMQELYSKLNTNNQCGFSMTAASQWLALRLQMIGVALTTGVAFLSVIEHHRVDTITGEIRGVDPALVGLVLSYVLSVTSLLSGVITSFTETEREMVSVERVQQYLQDPDMKADDKLVLRQPPFGWPHLGWLKFVNVTLRYKVDGQAALDDISFDVPAGMKLGIVGRTGAGKSSIIQALFQLRPLDKGAVFIDGIDLCTVSAQLVRERLSAIPQDAFVFVGTIRDNIDPSGMHSDYELWNALTVCHLHALVQNGGGLDGFLVEERGANLSGGQRQLVCLARAILQKSKVLCLDEATSGVDMETEAMIQRTLNSNPLRGTTVILVAHRVNTVLENCDLAMVMAAGKVIQFGPPKDLVNVEGPFKEMVNGDQ